MTDSIEPVWVKIPWEQTVEGAPGLRFDVALAHLISIAIADGHDQYSVVRALHYRAQVIGHELQQAEGVARGYALGSYAAGPGPAGMMDLSQGFVP